MFQKNQCKNELYSKLYNIKIIKYYIYICAIIWRCRHFDKFEWKTLLPPMVNIQDIQREQEIIIFDQIAVADHNKPIKDFNHVSKTIDPPSKSPLTLFIYTFLKLVSSYCIIVTIIFFQISKETCILLFTQTSYRKLIHTTNLCQRKAIIKEKSQQ